MVGGFLLDLVGLTLQLNGPVHYHESIVSAVSHKIIALTFVLSILSSQHFSIVCVCVCVFVCLFVCLCCTAHRSLCHAGNGWLEDQDRL